MQRDTLSRPSNLEKPRPGWQVIIENWSWSIIFLGLVATLSGGLAIAQRLMLVPEQLTFSGDCYFYLAFGLLIAIAACKVEQLRQGEKRCRQAKQTLEQTKQELEQQLEVHTQASEARFRCIVETAGEGVWILGPGNTTTFANRKIAEMLQVTPDSMMGRSLFDFMDAEDQHACAQYLQRRQQGITEQHDFRFKRQDGTDLWVIIEASPLLDANGDYAGALGMLTDITARKQVEEALRKSEQRYASLAAAVPVGIFRADAQGKCVYVNDRWCQITGFTPEQSQNDGWMQILHPEDRDRVLEVWEQNANHKTPFALEYRLQRPDGAITWVYGQAIAETSDTGEIIGYIGTIIDISDRRVTELEMDQQRDLQEAIFNGSTDALFLVDPQTLLILDCNRRAVEMFDADHKEQLIGIQGHELQRYQFPPGELEMIVEEIHTQGFWSRELEYVTFKGREFWGNLASKPIFVTGQEITLARVTDITDRKRIEAERRRVEARLHYSEVNLANAQRIAHLGSWELHFPSMQRVWSEETFRIFGLDPKTKPPDQATFLQMIHPDDRLRIQQVLQQAIADRQPFTEEYRIIRPDGSLRYLETRAELRVDEQKQSITFFGSILDISDRKQVEEELKRNHEQLEIRVAERTAELQAVNHRLQQLAVIVESSEDAIISKSLDGTILTWNAGAEKLFGYTAAEAIGQSIQFLCPLHQSDCICQILERIQAGESFDRYEAVRRRKDGSLIQVSITISPIKDINGKVIAASAIQRDITHQKQADLALQQAHDQLAQRSRQLERVNRALTHTLTDLQGVQEELRLHAQALQYSETRLREAQRIAHLGSWEFDLSTQEISWSEEMFQIFGWSSMQGAPTYLEMLQFIHPGDREMLEQWTARLSIEIPLVQVEYRVVRPDGSIRYLEGRSQIVQDSQGHVVKLFGIALDITERKQFEDSLRRYQRVFAATTDGYCLVDRDYIYQLVNPTYVQWHQRSAKQLLGHTMSEVLGTELFNGEIKSKLDQCFSGEVVEYNLWITYPYQGRQFMGVSYSPFYEPDGAISGAVISLRNLTKLKQIELEVQQAKEAAEAASQAKSLFLANMSHELRTPLNVILGFAQVMNRDPNLTVEQREYLLTIHRSGDHLLSLINDVLDLSKLEAGRATLTESEFDLIELLHILRDMFQYRAAERGLQFSLAIAPEVPCYISADAKKLRQVLINLLANAIQFTQQGQVSLRVAVAESEREKTLHSEHATTTSATPAPQLTTQPIILTFEVEDTGVGIPPEDLDDIFTAFVQSHAGTMTTGGTGLGLTISSRFVELMGGKISVHSTLGQGSCFQFAIPVRLAFGITRPVPPTASVLQLAPDQLQYRILVVDDQLENRQLLAKLMTQLGLDTQTASTGEAAIALWQQWHPHLIWMDLQMPDLDGYEVTRHIRATAEEQPVIIALTAYTSASDRDRALAAGCNHFMTKPVREEDLFSALTTYLGLRYVEANDPRSPPPIAPLLASTDSTAIALSLSVMPSDWRQALCQAALLCNKQEVLHLLKHIPSEHFACAQHLNNLVRKYQFDDIARLIQQSNDASA